MKFAHYAAHMEKVADDVNYYIPDVNFSGLAVIDWERWRPVFRRNTYNAAMRPYVIDSVSLVRAAHPDWSYAQVFAQAEVEFEQAAR